MPTAQIWNGAAWVEIQAAAAAHHAAHEPGGADALAADADVATASLRTLGTGATQAAVGDHGHSGTYEATGVAASLDATHVAAADPHTGYVLESLLDAKGDLIAASADNTPAKVTVGTDGFVLTADAASTAGIKWAIAAVGGNALFGNGNDGVTNFDGTTTVLGLIPSSGVYTLTRDLYLAGGSQVSGTAVIKTANYRIFCSGTLTVGASATVQCNGVAGATNGGGAGIASGVYGISGSGGNGALGAGGAGTSKTNSVGGAGGNSGAGTGGAAGTGGTAAAPAATAGGIPRSAPIPVSILGATTVLSGGAGGGGGSGEGTNFSGGGGGSGGGVLVIAAKSVVNGGVISANGGNGATRLNGPAGGGGGGGGGGVFLVYNSFSGNAPTANGGAHGNGVGGGTNGVDGSPGNVITIVNA
jgi:hypothetical protein